MCGIQLSRRLNWWIIIIIVINILWTFGVDCKHVIGQLFIELKFPTFSVFSIAFTFLKLVFEHDKTNENDICIVFNYSFF